MKQSLMGLLLMGSINSLIGHPLSSKVLHFLLLVITLTLKVFELLLSKKFLRVQSINVSNFERFIFSVIFVS